MRARVRGRVTNGEILLIAEEYPALVSFYPTDSGFQNKSEATRYRLFVLSIADGASIIVKMVRQKQILVCCKVKARRDEIMQNNV